MKPRQKLALAATDFFLVLAAIFIAVGLRLDFDFQNSEKLAGYVIGGTQYAFMAAIASATVASFYFHGLYEKVWRYAGTHELVGVVRATFLSLLPFQVVVMAKGGTLFPRTGLALTFIVAVNICGGIRLLLRLASETMGKPMTTTRVIVVGVNDAGASIVADPGREHNYVGFVDDRKELSGHSARGVPVLGALKDLPSLIDSHLVTQVVLAAPAPAQVRQVMELVKGRDVQLRVVPAVHDLVAGRVELNKLRKLSIEDLLEREPIKVDPELVRPLLAGKRVLITGAGGSIGSEIARQVASFGPEQLLLLGRGENSIYEIGLELPQAMLRICDVCRKEILEGVFEEFRPHFVFHAAAHKHVPLMEATPAEAVYTNVFGTLNVLNACQKYKVERFVLLSTDKAVNPTNVMGATKRMAEKLVAQLAYPGYAAVRFGNVLGSRGSVVPTMQKQISQGGPVTVTDPEMTRFFMTIPEAVTLVLQASSLAQGGEIYLLDMGHPVRILDLAHNLIRLCGYEPEKEIPIKITGVRPGEKLTEQLVGVGETTQATSHPKVQKVLSAVPRPDWPGTRLEELHQLCRNGDNPRSRELLMELLAEADAQGESWRQSEAS